MPNKHWLELPNVKAPAPDDYSKFWTVGISEAFVEGNAKIVRRTPIFQVWAHVEGELPPIPNISLLAAARLTPEVTSLEDSVACFEGVNRPYDTEVNGVSVLTYIIAPRVSIAHEPSMACLAKSVRVPEDTVLTVQVRPVSSLQEPRTGVDGLVTRLEFVSSEGGESVLPVDHASRYGKLLWTR